MARLSLFVFVSAISALPLHEFSKFGGIHSRSISQLVPLNNLPSPTSNSSSSILRYIALGVGHQNYTCGSDPSAAPTSIGATAKLFNVEDIFREQPFLIPTLPGIALAVSQLTVSIGPATSSPSGDQTLSLPALTPFGEHFFDLPAMLPVFNLHGAQPPARIEATKQADVPAPAGSCPGINDQGAVDWLMLGNSGSSVNFGGLSTVYRVETAGGKPAPTCQGMAAGSVIRVPYAAEYWFYGNEVECYGDEGEQ